MKIQSSILVFTMTGALAACGGHVNNYNLPNRDARNLKSPAPAAQPTLAELLSNPSQDSSTYNEAVKKILSYGTPEEMQTAVGILKDQGLSLEEIRQSLFENFQKSQDTFKAADQRFGDVASKATEDSTGDKFAAAENEARFAKSRMIALKDMTEALNLEVSAKTGSEADAQYANLSVVPGHNI